MMTDTETLAEKVGADGRKTYQHRSQSLFKAVDTDGSGQIDKAEFGKLYDLIKVECEAELAKEAQLEKDAKRSKRQMKMAFCVAGLMFAALLIVISAMAGVTYALIEGTKETHVKGSTMIGTDGTPVGTTESLVSVPMYVAPVLPLSTLAKVKSVDVTIAEKTAFYKNVKTHMTIVEVRKFNSTFVEMLSSIDGRSLVIINGQAYVLSLPAKSGRGIQAVLNNELTAAESAASKIYPVCSADVECSAFKVSDADVSQLTSQADTELTNIGIAAAGGRRLDSVSVEVSLGIVSVSGTKDC